MTVKPNTQVADDLLKKLSPPFINMNDAARYAMTQIDRSLGRAYGGYLLTDPSGECRATQPVEGVLDDFLFSDPLIMEAATDLLLPRDYHYEGYYFCDIDRHSWIKQQRPGWSEQRIALTQSVPGAKAVAATHSELKAFYSIGPEGSLVRFVPDERALQNDFVARMKARFSEQALELPPEHEPVERYVGELMAAGQVLVIVTSPAWAGWRGALSEHWRPYLADPQSAVPDPYLSQIHGSTLAAMADAHQRMLRQPAKRQMGFMLKHLVRQRFTVSEPVAVDEVTYDPAAVFESDYDGGIFLRHGWGVVGAYSLCVQAGTPPTLKERWLYERFIAPMELAHGINLSRSSAVLPGFAMYFSTDDGAQLKLGFPSVEAQTPFFNPLPTPQRGMDNNTQAALLNGRLTPTAFVRRIAEAGDLRVLKTSPLWDVPGRVNAQWQPYANDPQRGTGPAFVLADDAARDAHERIGCRRDAGYIGLILQRADQRFVATLPLKNPAERFDPSALFAHDRQGTLIVLLAGHTLHGVYSSRWRGDMAERTWPEDEANVAAQMFTDTDVHAIYTGPPGLAVAYLSGSADSLLAYEPFAPGMNHDFRARVRWRDGGSLLSHELRDGTLMPSDVVREMVLAGTLRVVVGNRTWGPPGKITSDWSGPFEPDTSHVPKQPELGPVFATAREAVVEACARWRARYAISASGLGLVLKHKARDEFVATQTVAGPMLDQLYQASEFGAQVLIDDFRVNRVYFSARGLPAGLNGQDAWLARHFMDAASLYHALYDRAGVRRGGLMQRLALTSSVLDGALLEYVPWLDPYPLFCDETGQVDPQVLPAKLALSLTERGYIRQVAANGQLEVVSGSECWGEPGPVKADWVAFAEVSRRHLGPVFISADDAARHAALQLGTRRDTVYGGLILRRRDGLFTATEPVPVSVEDFAPGLIRLDELVSQSQSLGASTAVARYHSRIDGQIPFALSDGERRVYLNMFASDFLGPVLRHATASAKQSTGQEYLICADGAVLCYTASGSALEQSLANRLGVPASGTTQRRNNEIERRFYTGALTPSAFVNQVARAGELRVVQGSPLWGPARRLDFWLADSTDVTPPVSVDAPFTAVYVQLADVQRYLHQHAGTRGQLSFGLLLKAKAAEHYVASLALPAGTGPLSLDRVLRDGLVPQGFELLGLYLCPPAQPDVRQDEPWYRNLVSPRDLARAWGIKGPGSAANLPVYLSCVDGAWLKLTPRSALPFGQDLPADFSPRDAAQPAGLAFGRLFSHPDDAARHTAPPSQRFAGKEYLGVVLVDAQAGAFVAAEPLEDHGVDSLASQRLLLHERTLLSGPVAVPAYPAGYQLLAVQLFFKTMKPSAHWAPGETKLAEHFVGQDELGGYRRLLQVNAVRGACCYITTRQGALIKYTPRFTPREEALFSGELFFGPEQFLPTQWLSRLATDGLLQVLRPDDYWTRRGVVEVEWSRTDDKETPRWAVRPTKDEL